MHRYLAAFLRDEEGLTMVEYAVAGTMITLAVVTAFQTLGKNVTTQITTVASYLKTGA